MLERGINRFQVKKAIIQGSIIEYYLDDYPIPSVLVFILKSESQHVAVAYDADTLQRHIITAYRPDLAHFETDFITRKLT